MAKISGIHTPSAIRQYILNGAMDFFNRATTVTVNTATFTTNYLADRFSYYSNGGTVKNYTISRSTDVPSFGQTGFNSTYSLQCVMNATISSLAAGDQIAPFNYKMEGLDYAKLHSKTVTLSFWFKSSLAGTYSCSFNNGTGTRSYVTTFTVNAINTWEQKIITVTLDNTGTWALDTGLGLFIQIAAVSGSTASTSTGSWQGGNYNAATGATNWAASSGLTMKLAQVSLVEGVNPLPVFSRVGDTIADELSLCQRYCVVVSPAGTYPIIGYGWKTGGTQADITIPTNVPMRAQPSPTLSANSDWHILQDVTAIGISAFSTNSQRYAAGIAASGFYITTSGSISGSTMLQLKSATGSGYLILDAEL